MGTNNSKFKIQNSKLRNSTILLFEFLILNFELEFV